MQHTLEPLVYHGPAEGQPRERMDFGRMSLATRTPELLLHCSAFRHPGCGLIAPHLAQQTNVSQRLYDRRLFQLMCLFQAL